MGSDVKREWLEEVPPRRPGRKGEVDHYALALEAKAHPGLWTPVKSFPNVGQSASFAYHVRTGRIKAYGPGFEAASRRDMDGTYKVFIRWAEGEGDVGHP